jgi:ribosomal protein S18 acetylase RimI-like enzyme
MPAPDHQFIYIEKLEEGDRLPLELLLLADEHEAAINKYIFSSEVYVAKHPQYKQPIAVFVLQKMDEQSIELRNIAVDEAFQGQGIGSYLIAQIKEIAAMKRAEIVWVGTPSSAARQLNFYQKNGFRIAGIRKDFYLLNYPKPIYENGKLLTDMVMLQAFIARAAVIPGDT